MEGIYYYTGLILINLIGLLGIIYLATKIIEKIINYLGDNFSVFWRIIEYNYNKKEYKKWQERTCKCKKPEDDPNFSICMKCDKQLRDKIEWKN